jgi:hypothetical protein
MGARYAVIAAAVLGLAQPALAATGSQSDPMPVHFKRGADTVRLKGELKPNVQCCAYRLKAHAGQSLYWRFTGPAFRAVMTYPDGQTDGPGLSSPIRLPLDGVYVLTFSPNLMADGAFGRFKLTLRIPPKGLPAGGSRPPPNRPSTAAQ